jgi:hypothetical protein
MKKGNKVYYNLFTSKAMSFPKSVSISPLPFDNNPINKNSEILIATPHLTPEHFVKCTKFANKRPRVLTPEVSTKKRENYNTPIKKRSG